MSEQTAKLDKAKIFSTSGILLGMLIGGYVAFNLAGVNASVIQQTKQLESLERKLMVTPKPTATASAEASASASPSASASATPKAASKSADLK
jgi:hypothetical protein